MQIEIVFDAIPTRGEEQYIAMMTLTAVRRKLMRNVLSSTTCFYTFHGGVVISLHENPLHLHDAWLSLKLERSAVTSALTPRYGL